MVCSLQDADINTVVFDVQATDADFAANSLLLFYIVQVDGIVCGQCVSSYFES